MFLTKKARQKIIDDVFAEMQRRKEIEDWCDFFFAHKEGYLIKYQGIEWECTDEHRGCLKHELALKVGDQIKFVSINYREPQDISFVYED